MAKIFILGGGRVGYTIAKVLSTNHQVTILDLKPKKSTPAIRWKSFDFTNLSGLPVAIAPADLVIGAVPGSLGYNVLKQVIESGKNVVDISFFPENGLRLNALAKRKKVVAAFDCGVAPGMDNILVGHHDVNMTVHSFYCYVGGLPFIKNPPLNYKATFSPADVLEEYTRPTRLQRGGKTITLKALTELETIRFNKEYVLEAFNSDGLRSLLITMQHIPTMAEKTLRFPGHAAQMELLREIGLLSKKTIKYNDQTVVPLMFTQQLLFPHWQFKPKEADLTLMRVLIQGKEQGKLVRYKYDLIDVFDSSTGLSSMSRTTGVTACAVAECILGGLWNQPGVAAPEHIGREQSCFQFIMDYQKANNIIYRKTKTLLHK